METPGSDVSVIIPNWNGAGRLERTLSSLARQTLPPAEVIVVDNGSTDASAAAAEALGARLIRLNSNLGFAAAVNRGLAASESTWVAIVNNDVVLSDNWLQQLLTAAQATAAPFACGCLLALNSPGQIDGCYDLLARSACACRVGHGRNDAARYSTPERIHWAPFTAALFERALFTRLGPLDERFESYLEDVDFGLRCALAGVSGLYVPEATAWHEGSATLGVWSPRMVRLIARNQLLLVAKNYSVGWLRDLLWPVLTGQLLWGLAALRRGRFLDWLQGKREGLQLYDAIRRNSRQAPLARLLAVLESSEDALRRDQQGPGADRYWKLYFKLTS